MAIVRLGVLLLVVSFLACGQSRPEPEQHAPPPVVPTPAPRTPEPSAPPAVEPDETSEEPSGEPGPPTEVLDGTDTVELSTLGSAAEGQPAAGRYSAEHGGSTGRAILRHQGDAWSLEIIAREPGEPAERRRYTLRVEGDQLVGDDGVHVRGTREGVVVLEPNVAYWVHYIR